MAFVRAQNPDPDENKAVKMDFLKSGDEEEISKPHFPYKCEICDKGFEVSIALKNHMYKHLSKGNQTFWGHSKNT